MFHILYISHGCIPLTLCMLGDFSCFYRLLLFFSKLIFSENSFRNTIRVTNSLDPDQDRHSVGPDLGPNFLRRLSANLIFCLVLVQTRKTGNCPDMPENLLIAIKHQNKQSYQQTTKVITSKERVGIYS